MRRSTGLSIERRLGIGLVLLALVITMSAATPGVARRAVEPRLYLHRGIIDPRAEPGLASVELATVNPGLAVVQFDGPVGPMQRAALQTSGLTIIDYIPDYAYLVRGDAAALRLAARLPGFYGQLNLRSADKLSPELLEALLRKAYDRPVPLTIWAWPGREQAMIAELAAAGIDPRQPFDAATAQRAAALPSVRWLEPRQNIMLLNDQARTIIGVDKVWQDVGLYGAGQVLAIADSGLDTGNTQHADFAGRIIATQVLSAGGDLADEYGHGTHVTGSAAGSGVLSGANPAQHAYNGSFAGVAPEVSLVLQAFETASDGSVLGLSEDTYPLYSQAYSATARLHSNSWGGIGGVPIFQFEDVFGSYPVKSQRTDEFVWDHPDMTIFFAAGNSGDDGWWAPEPIGCTAIFFETDGVIDEDSLLSPGTAKNVITVGASESLQTTGDYSTKLWKSKCWSAEPIASDTPSDDPNGIAAFSSRGPTDDGRMKPDLVAPGTNIISDRSREPGASKLWGLYAANTNYAYSGGTSMAAPLAAGAGVLVREWLTRTKGLANPSAAAVKATMLNTTRDIAPGQYGTGATQEIPYTRPNRAAGWGRLDLSFIIAPEPYQLWVDDHSTGLATGQSVSYTGSAAQPLSVQASDQPLRVMLVWSDPPAAAMSAKQLVNDLDLIVRGPGGQIYWGNGRANGDRIDNVEGIVIDAPALGSYTIEVRAHNIPIDTQPYALVVAGAITQAGAPTASATATSTATGTSEPVSPTQTSSPSPTPTSPLPSPTPTILPTITDQRRLYLPLIRQ